MAAPLSPKEHFLDILTKEHAKTARVLRAIPTGQSEFQPHERSQSIRQLAYTFTMEQMMMSRAIKGEFTMGGSMPPIPEKLETIIAQFEKDFAELAETVRTTPEEKLYSTTLQFPRAPKQMGEWSALEFAWNMLFDQIHHRGQMSVYLRMAGGKVPSIYGPSADEPWR